MALFNRFLTKRLEKSRIRLNKQKEKVRIREMENRELKNELRSVRRELADVKSNMLLEFCGSCEEWFMIVWDPENGLVAYCPYCGERVMLCSICEKDGIDCDYNPVSDLCSEM